MDKETYKRERLRMWDILRTEYIRVCANCPLSGFIVDCKDVDCESVIRIWNELKERERFEKDKDV